MSRRYEIRRDGTALSAELVAADAVRVDGHLFHVERLDAMRCLVTGEDGSRSIVAVAGTTSAPWLFAAGQPWQVEVAAEGARARPSSAAGQDMAAPMPATVVSIAAPAGSRVTAGDPVVVLEAMTMVLVIRAPRDGEIAAVHCRVGELVQPGTRLAELAP